MSYQLQPGRPWTHKSSGPLLPAMSFLLKTTSPPQHALWMMAPSKDTEIEPQAGDSAGSPAGQGSLQDRDAEIEPQAGDSAAGESRETATKLDPVILPDTISQGSTRFDVEASPPDAAMVPDGPEVGDHPVGGSDDVALARDSTISPETTIQTASHLDARTGASEVLGGEPEMPDGHRADHVSSPDITEECPQQLLRSELFVPTPARDDLSLAVDVPFGPSGLTARNASVRFDHRARNAMLRR